MKGSSVVTGATDVVALEPPGQVTFTTCCRSKLNVDLADAPKRSMKSLREAVSSAQLRSTFGAC